MTRPACVVVSRHAAKANLQRVRELAPSSRVMAVVKADAYGHGLVRIAEALGSADAFGVACLEEAVALRDAGIENPVVLLEGPFSAEELQVAAQLGLETIVHNEMQLSLLERTPIKGDIKIWLKIDTGMHRLGFDPPAVADAYRRLCECDAVADVPRLMTHFAQAHESDRAAVALQLAVFEEVTAGLAGERSSANSAALIGWPECRSDWVRPGLMLYGVSPCKENTAAQLGLSPVMALRSKLIAVKQVAAGEGVGYGAGWRCPESMQVGVVAIGYGDGYPRHAGTGTPILINGFRTQVIGVSSMDMLSVDLRPVESAKVGDPVVLWGDELPVEEVARAAGTMPYELLCGVRVRAQYVDAD